MTVQSGTVEGFSVVLWPGMCHVSKGYYHATLGYLRQHMCLRDSRGAGFTVSPHQINVIKAWAKAHGYIKERKRARTQAGWCEESGTFTAEQWRKLDGSQRALPFDVPTPKARRRAGTAGDR